MRGRAVFLSLSLFAVLWLAVFAQIVSGHDPVLGSGAAAGTKVAPQRKANTRPARSASQGEWVVDPETGVIERVPSGASQAATPSQPAAPAPVITSQS